MKVRVDVSLSFVLTDKNLKYVQRVFKNLKKNGIKLSEPKSELDGFK